MFIACPIVITNMKQKVESLLLLPMDDFTFRVIRRLDYKYYTNYYVF